MDITIQTFDSNNHQVSLASTPIARLENIKDAVRLVHYLNGGADPNAAGVARKNLL